MATNDLSAEKRPIPSWAEVYQSTTLASQQMRAEQHGDAPFFERFYLGGIGSVRGFRYRGISPRSGIGEDPIGGDFMAAGSAELNFPLAGDLLRGVTFFDAGTVNRELEVGTIRTSVGFGFRLTLPFFGQAKRQTRLGGTRPMMRAPSAQRCRPRAHRFQR